MEMENTFQTKINAIFNDKQAKQYIVAREIGVRQSQIHNWLFGNSQPGYENIEKICKYFDVEPNFWFGK